MIRFFGNIFDFFWPLTIVHLLFPSTESRFKLIRWLSSYRGFNWPLVELDIPAGGYRSRSVPLPISPNTCTSNSTLYNWFVELPAIQPSSQLAIQPTKSSKTRLSAHLWVMAKKKSRPVEVEGEKEEDMAKTNVSDAK